jgi:hypothetical protein
MLHINAYMSFETLQTDLPLACPLVLIVLRRGFHCRCCSYQLHNDVRHPFST